MTIKIIFYDYQVDGTVDPERKVFRLVASIEENKTAIER